MACFFYAIPKFASYSEVWTEIKKAGVLVFRALTYGIQIPLGAITYLIWRSNKSWRTPVAVPAPVAVP